MGFQGPPVYDFYNQLSGLGDTLQANAALRQKQQINAARQGAFADFTALDPSSPDYGKQAMTIAQKLGQAGDQDGAVKFLTVAQANADRVRQTQRDAVSDQHWNADYGLRKRSADRADDPTPAGFEKDPSTGALRPIAGGPRSPEYLSLAAKAEADAKANTPQVLGAGSAIIVPAKAADGPLYRNVMDGGASIPDEVATTAAQRILAGEKGVKTGYGRGAQGPANLIKIDAEVSRLAKEQGLSGADIAQRGIDYVGDTSRERTAATQEGRMTSAGIEAKGAIDLGRKASDAVPRTSWVPVNRAIQAYQANTSDPALKAFGASNLTIINTYARAINPNGVGTVADKEHAAEMLRTADGPEAYKAVLDQLDKEIEMAHQSPAKARAGFKAERAGRMGGNGAPLPDRSLWPRATNAAGNVLVLDPSKNMWVPEK